MKYLVFHAYLAGYGKDEEEAWRETIYVLAQDLGSPVVVVSVENEAEMENRNRWTVIVNIHTDINLTELDNLV